jgi:hypothetical protein
MDDWVVIASSRWQLRQAIRVVNQQLALLHLRQHPDKTWIGRAQRGRVGQAPQKTRRCNRTARGCPGKTKRQLITVCGT